MLACRCLSSSFSVSLSLRVFGREGENLGGVKINPNVWLEGNDFIRLQCDVLIWNRAGVLSTFLQRRPDCFFLLWFSVCGGQCVCVEASIRHLQCVEVLQLSEGTELQILDFVEPQVSGTEKKTTCSFLNDVILCT